MERASMRKIREILRLKFDRKLSARQIARSAQVARSTVAEYERRFIESGLTWPLPPISDAELEQRLYPPQPSIPATERVAPDWVYIQQEMHRPGVTLFLLWQEYKAEHPTGYGYSWCSTQYRDWKGKLDLVMRQEHRAGEKLFVDYAGQTAEVVDRSTGEVRSAQIFVAVLGASSYTFAEATWSQQLSDWIGSHVRAFAFFGGVSEVIVPDYVPRNIIGVMCPS